MANGLYRLRHHAIVCGDDQNNDVCHRRPAAAHGRERLMAWRVDEGDTLVIANLDLIGTDMLGDTPGLPSRHVRAAQRIEQARLTVIDVPHDGHNGSPRLHVSIDVILAIDADLHVALADPAATMAELFDHQFGRVSVKYLRHRRHDAHAHQRLNHVGDTGGHAVGEFLHRDRLWQYDVAHDLDLVRAQHLKLRLPALPLA